jgi:hypothetical protein
MVDTVVGNDRPILSELIEARAIQCTLSQGLMIDCSNDGSYDSTAGVASLRQCCDVDGGICAV